MTFLVNKIKIYLNDLSTLHVLSGREIAIIAHICIKGSCFQKSVKSIIPGTYFKFHKLNHTKPLSTILSTNSP